MKKLLILLFVLVNLTSFAVEHTVTTRAPAGAKVLLHYNNDLINLATNREWTIDGSLMSVESDAAKYGTGGLEYRGSHSLATMFEATASDVADVAAIGTNDFMYQTWFRVAEITEATANNGHGLVTLYFYKNSSDYMTYAIAPRMIIGDYSHYNLSIQAFTVPAGGVSNHDASNLNVGEWYHVALVRRSGVLYTYLNGSLVQTATIAASAFNLTGLTRLYDYSHTTTAGVLATTHVDDSMITTDVYTGNFTPPAELGDIVMPKVNYSSPHMNSAIAPTNSKALLHFNGDLNNLSTGRDWIFVNNYNDFLSVEADAAKYGSGGLEYRWGYGVDAIVRAHNQDVPAIAAIGTGDFCVQTWFRVSEITDAEDPDYYSNRGLELYFKADPTSYIRFNISATSIVGNYSNYNLGFYINGTLSGSVGAGENNVNVGDWRHVAFVRRSGDFYVYLDGVEKASGTIPLGAFDLTDVILVEHKTNIVGNTRLTTQLDDLMISSDTYTGNFTPPLELGETVIAKANHGYKRYMPQWTDAYGTPVTSFAIPMELDGGSTIKSVGNYIGTGIMRNTYPTEGSKKFNKYGLKYNENLSNDCMLVFLNADSYIRSSTFTVGWWLRVDEVASVSTTLNDGFNVYLRKSNGLDNIRVGLVYYPDGSDLSKLDVCMGVRYRNGAVNSGYNTATTTLNVGDWYHFSVMRFTYAYHTYIYFYVNGTLLGWVADTPATSGSLSFANHLWLGWFGFTTPLEPYTTVRVSVDDFFYTPCQLYSSGAYTPPDRRTLTRYGSLAQ